MTLTTSDIDTALQPVLTALQQPLSGFSRMYGRVPVEAVKGMNGLPQGDKEKPRRVPLYYDLEKNTHIPIVPDEKQGGLLFFVTTGAAKLVDLEPGWAMTGANQFKQYPMALLMWWNRERIGGDLANPDEVRRLVEFELGRSYNWLTSTVEDNLQTRVFRDLDYDFDNHRYLLYPYCGLRIEGTLTVNERLC